MYKGTGMSLNNIYTLLNTVPELQGEPDEIARDKCRMAVERVSGLSLVMHGWIYSYIPPDSAFTEYNARVRVSALYTR